eukprot:scpid85490/ scgid0656/ 
MEQAPPPYTRLVQEEGAGPEVDEEESSVRVWAVTEHNNYSSVVHSQPMYPSAVAVERRVLVHAVGPDTRFGLEPAVVKCHHCGKTTLTNTTSQIAPVAWLFAFFLCLFGFVLCCWIPFVVPALRNVDHHCANCNVVVGHCGTTLTGV